MLVTGLANIDLWYPWPFFFPAAHYAVSLVVIGALIVHIGAKATISRGRAAPARGRAAGNGRHQQASASSVSAAAASALLVVTTSRADARLRCAAWRCSRRATPTSGRRASR